MLCKNNGHCVPTCDDPPPYFICECTEEWGGENCAVKVCLLPIKKFFFFQVSYLFLNFVLGEFKISLKQPIKTE